MELYYPDSEHRADYFWFSVPLFLRVFKKKSSSVGHFPRGKEGKRNKPTLHNYVFIINEKLNISTGCSNHRERRSRKLCVLAHPEVISAGRNLSFTPNK